MSAAEKSSINVSKKEPNLSLWFGCLLLAIAAFYAAKTVLNDRGIIPEYKRMDDTERFGMDFSAEQASSSTAKIDSQPAGDGSMGNWVQCVAMNTMKWGYEGTFKPELPVIDTPTQAFEALGIAGNYEAEVTVVQGSTQKPYKSGDVFANGSMFCIE